MTGVEESLDRVRLRPVIIVGLTVVLLTSALWLPRPSAGSSAPSDPLTASLLPPSAVASVTTPAGGPLTLGPVTDSWPLTLGISSNVTAVCAFGSPGCSKVPSELRARLTAVAPSLGSNSTAVQLLFLLDESPYTACDVYSGDCLAGESEAVSAFRATSGTIAGAIQTAHPGRNVSFGLAVTQSASGAYDDGDSQPYGVPVGTFANASQFGPAVNRSLLPVGDLDGSDSPLQTSVTTALFGAMSGLQGNTSNWGRSGPVNWTVGSDHVIVWVGATAPVDSNYTEYACPVRGYYLCQTPGATSPGAMPTCPSGLGLNATLPTCEGWNTSQNGNPLDSIAALAYNGSACVNSSLGHCTVDSVIVNATSTDAASLGWGIGNATGVNTTYLQLDVHHVIGAGCDIARDTGGSWDGPIHSMCGNSSGTLGFSPNATNPWLVRALANVSFGTPGGPWLAAPVAEAPLFRFVTTAGFQLAPDPRFVAECRTPTGVLSGCPQSPSVSQEGSNTLLGWNWSTAAGHRGMGPGDSWSAEFDLTATVGPNNATPVDLCGTSGCLAAENDSQSPTFSGAELIAHGLGSPIVESFPLLVVQLVAAPILAGSLRVPQTGGDIPAALSFQILTSGGYPPFLASWNFGDGAVANGASSGIQHTYSVPGTYHVRANLRDASGAEVNLSTWVWIFPPLVTGIITQGPAEPSPLTAAFTATPSGGDAPYSVAWSFGDGMSGVGSDVIHTFPAPGNYTVVATVSDAAGGVTTSAVEVAAHGAATVAALSARASVTSTSTGSCAATRTVYQFVGTASGGEAPYSFVWTFGDGDTASGPSVEHEYSAARAVGPYGTPTLTVLDSNGSSANVAAPLPATAVAGPPCPVATNAVGLSPLVEAAAFVGVAAAIVAVTAVALRSRRH